VSRRPDLDARRGATAGRSTPAARTPRRSGRGSTGRRPRAAPATRSLRPRPTARTRAATAATTATPPPRSTSPST
jgi:hypothetical protein